MFNVSFHSEFNAIEIAFNLIKDNFYNEVHNNLKEIENILVYLLNDSNMNNNIPKIYQKTLEGYLNFYNDNIGKVNISWLLIFLKINNINKILYFRIFFLNFDNFKIKI